jgi:hypothetical protein
MFDDRAGPDPGEIADADTADDGAEINAPADFGGAVRLREIQLVELFGYAERLYFVASSVMSLNVLANAE